MSLGLGRVRDNVGAGMAWQHGWIDPLRTLPPSQCVACDVSPTTVGRSVGRPEGRQRLRRASWDGTENGPCWIKDGGWAGRVG